MFVALVHIHIKPEYIDQFIAATLENARNSIQEPGIAQFDFIQQADDPTRFVLIEAYHSEDAPAKHRETAHYLKWRDTVPDMMAEPRTGIRYQYLLRTASE
jgi:quinol monooxygenase YgiN